MIKAVLIAGGLVASLAPIPDSPHDTDQTAQIIEALLSDFVTASGKMPPPGYLVLVSENLSICASAASSQDCVDSDTVELIRQTKLLPDEHSALRQALLEKNANRTALPAVSLPTIKRATAAAIEAIFRDAHHSWKRFYAQYPGSVGFVETTIPVVSSDSNHALTYFQYGCGGLCGGGRLVYLVRRGGVWQIENSVTVWVS